MAAFKEFMAARDELKAAEAAATEATEALEAATVVYQDAEERLLNYTGLIPLDQFEPDEPDSEDPSDGNGTSARPPSGDNVKALQIIARAGGVDSVDRGKLTKLLYGRDVKALRMRLYSRMRHWKDRGWLVKQDYDWVVAPGLLDA
jgi:hypothetical protein